jgi:hypothetical protein
MVLLAAAMAVSAGTACSDSSTSTSSSGASASSTPWTRQFTGGNFSINTGDVVTNQDGVSADILSDYVNASALPSANFEVFTVHFYLPSAESAEPAVSAARVTVGRVDGSRTPDILQKQERVQIATLDGERYTVFRVTGFTAEAPPITAANFANVSFEIDYAYGSQKSGTKTVEVYKR